LTAGNDWIKKLFAWFALARRDFPWREQRPRNPYHVWISEIMLQQTRTETVKSYFMEWMRHFPSIDALARAPEEEVLRVWQGLGYYSRARNLHKAAKEVVLNCGGKLPKSWEELKKLPGIGDYTAGAICSMAYGQAVAAVDGNLLRVLARLYACDDDVLSTAGRRKISALAAKLIPPDAPGDFNEAMMDLGASICVPGNPHCDDCPLQGSCLAFKEGRTKELPVRRKKTPQKIYFAVCVFLHKNRVIWLHKRPDTGLLASLWELPTFLGKTAEESRQAAESEFGSLGIAPIWKHKHVFSHQIWYMEAYESSCQEPLSDAAGQWISEEDICTVPLCGPCERFLSDMKIL
jgi:A/G-specific adenine glycosylase